MTRCLGMMLLRVGVFGIALLTFRVYTIVGNLQQRLNMNERPIANKYCEGKMKSTLKRRLKELEIVKGKGTLSLEIHIFIKKI